MRKIPLTYFSNSALVKSCKTGNNYSIIIMSKNCGDGVMLAFYRENKAEIDKVLALFAFLLFVYVFVKYVFGYVAPFAVGFLFAAMLEPVVRFFCVRFKFKRGLAAFVSILLLIFVIGFLGNFLVQKLITQAGEYAKALPEYVTQVTNAVSKLRSKYDYMFSLMPDSIQGTIDTFGDTVTKFATDTVSSGVKEGSKGIIKTIPGVIMGVMLCLISTFFFIKDKEQIGNALKERLPKIVRDKLRIIEKSLFHALNGYVKAQLIIMSMIATIMILGLLLIGYPYALFVGIIIAFVDALPIFGSGIVLWPWMAVSILSANYGRAVSLLVLYIAGVLTRQFMEPKVLGTQLGIHPIITLMAIYIGLKLFGFLGLIIGPVIVLIAIGFFDAVED